MNLLDRFWRSNFLIKGRSWEYWPFELVYLPIFGYWLWLSLKARSFFFFSASNPGIENGGMLGESKFKILSKISDNLVPKTLCFNPSITIEHIRAEMDRMHLTFPVICKPDIGERGWMVQKIESENQLSLYIEQMNSAFLVQEYVDMPIEVGVFYYRSPGAKKGTVSSVVLKEMLTVTGDGKSTLQKLILRNDRAKLQWHSLKEKFSDSLSTVLKANEQIELVSIGNHCKGTKFLNGNYLINEKLTSAFDEISKNIQGFFYGRYDLRVSTIEDLYAGQVKIMELNGAGAEPAHIYHPGSSLRKAYRVLFHHWKVLYEISRENHALGIPYLSLKDGWTVYRQVRQLKK